MKPRITPVLIGWHPDFCVRRLKRIHRGGIERRLRERDDLRGTVARWITKRRDRRLLALGRKLLRKEGKPTAGGDCRKTRTNGGRSKRDRVIGMAAAYLRSLKREPRCGMCGAYASFMENPCGNPCDEMPF